jgi:hypothetical protein
MESRMEYWTWTGKFRAIMQVLAAAILNRLLVRLLLESNGMHAGDKTSTAV